jgi:hypothetical protein
MECCGRRQRQTVSFIFYHLNEFIALRATKYENENEEAPKKQNKYIVKDF